MSYTVSLQQRIQQLKKAQADLPEILRKTAKGATLRAIEAAMDATPPKKGTGALKGVNTRTGELKAHWATDSKIEPMGGALSGGSSYTTILANDKAYASYVDQGTDLTATLFQGCTSMKTVCWITTRIMQKLAAWWLARKPGMSRASS